MALRRRSYISRNSMITKDHISVKRHNFAKASLEARISALSEIVAKKEVPLGFEYHKSNERLMKWNDPSIGITKIGINTARDKHPTLWKTLQELRKDVGSIIESEIKTKTKTSKNKTINHPNAELEVLVKRLTNELIMLRSAYLDLLDSADQDKIKNRVIQEAIRRHHKHHGLQNLVKDK